MKKKLRNAVKAVKSAASLVKKFLSIRRIITILLIISGILSAMANAKIWGQVLRIIFWRTFLCLMIANLVIDLFRGLYKKEIRICFRFGIPVVIASIGYVCTLILSHIWYTGTSLNLLFLYFSWRILCNIGDGEEDDDDDGEWEYGVIPWTHCPNPFVRFKLTDHFVCHQIFLKTWDTEKFSNIKNWNFSPDLTVGKARGGFTFYILPDKWGEAVEVWGHMPYGFALKLDRALSEYK